MDFDSETIKQLYDFVCSKVFRLSEQSEQTVTQLYNYIISLNDTDLWKPNTPTKKRIRIWENIVGSEFNPVSRKHRKKICQVLSTRVANIVLQSSNNNNNIGEDITQYMPDEILVLITDILADEHIAHLLPVKRVSKRWNALAEDSYSRKTSDQFFLLNFLTNLWYHTPGTDEIACFNDYQDPETGRIHAASIAYFEPGGILFFDEPPSIRFAQYLVKTLHLTEQYISNPDEGVMRLRIHVTKLDFPQGVTNHNDVVVLIHPMDLFSAIVSYDRQVFFRIYPEFFFSSADKLNSTKISRTVQSHVQLSMEEEMEQLKTNNYSDQTPITSNPQFVNNLPLELVERHATRGEDTQVVINYLVPIIRIKSFIERYRSKLISIIWFSKSVFNDYLSSDPYLDGKHYILADKKFIEGYLENEKKKEQEGENNA